MDIDYTLLNKDTLANLISEIILREGTDYGSHEKAMNDKVELVMKQLENGKAKIVYDHDSDSCNIITS